MAAEAVAAEQPAITRTDLRALRTDVQQDFLEFKTGVQQDIQESEDRIHRELQHYATKADLKDTELRLGSEISGLRADLKDTELRLKTEISGLRTEFGDLRTEFSDLRTELKVELRDAQMWLLLRLGGLIVAAVTIAVAILKLLEGAG